MSPQHKVIETFQGSGKSMEKILLDFAERQIHLGQTDVGREIGENLATENSNNIEANNVIGYAAIEEGDLDKAEKLFSKISDMNGKGEILDKEGLASVFLKKGQTSKAF